MDTLINKQYKSYNYFSRYTPFPYYYDTVAKRYIYGTTSQLKQDVPYILYKVKKGDTWDSIALQYYNSTSYYWVLLDFNALQDPFVEPMVNSSIKVPTLNLVSFKGV